MSSTSSRVMTCMGDPPAFILPATRPFSNMVGTVAASLSMMPWGVPLGTITPRKLTLELSTSRPASIIVGTSGRNSFRSRSATARILTLPASRARKASDRLLMPAITSPAITAFIAAAPPPLVGMYAIFMSPAFSICNAAMWCPTNRPAPEVVSLPGFSLAKVTTSSSVLNALSAPTTSTAGSAPQFAIGSKLSREYCTPPLID
mmetsp:Transcript_1866/g.3216  ORF Transcript_1866/g.3216 Transcript_1866/m.3216 type:complete len:204 (-) Transcript_1866:495-1106(-)